MYKKFYLFLLCCLLGFMPCYAAILPEQFVFLKEVSPSIMEDLRYATSYNFIGKKINGYNGKHCILTRPAALALAQVQNELKQSKLSLKVYDCYRPQIAVDEFITWSQDPHNQKMKLEFYPRINKADVFKLEYVAMKSGHTRGSTIDLTIVPDKSTSLNQSQRPQHLTSCLAPYLERFNDGGIDMGTGFDCLDILAHPKSKSINLVAQSNRLLLRNLMKKYGFVPSKTEWWHFTYKNEPFPSTYFDFPIENKSTQ